MKRFSRSLFVFALLLPSFATAATAQEEACHFAEEPIPIGTMAPLSAPGAVLLGQQIVWAVQLAVDEWNVNCGIEIDGVNHRIELAVGDNEGLPERAQAALERMIFEDGVVAVVGDYHSAVGLATMGIYQQNAIPMIFSGPWNDNISANGIQAFEGQPARITTNEAGIDYVFRISPAISFAATVMIDWLLHVGSENVVIIAENTDYGVPASEKDAELLAAGGARSDIYHVELGQEDFLPLLTRILAAAELPDAVILEMTGETSLNLAQQMAEVGLAPNEDTLCVLVDEIAYAGRTFWETVPYGNYCVFFRVGIVPPLFNEMTHFVADSYLEAFGDDISSYALAAYDAFWLMAGAIERANTITDKAAIVRQIELSDVTLAQGHYHFRYGSHNPDLGDEPAWMWHQWPDPALTMMQYFSEGQPGPEAAVIWPPQYQTHGTALIPYGSTPGE
ncbi:MAG: ABC transporter substrate-binding protein [Chloroflexi bacterium]|nr:ABC transporter substrate-binding protein [Chloroflexota bacterium]